MDTILNSCTHAHAFTCKPHCLEHPGQDAMEVCVHMQAYNFDTVQVPAARSCLADECPNFADLLMRRSQALLRYCTSCPSASLVCAPFKGGVGNTCTAYLLTR
jgi:hypothetical protein